MNKERITITIDEKLLKWLDKEIKAYRFANRSHAIEFLLAQEKEKKASSRGKNK